MTRRTITVTAFLTLALGAVTGCSSQPTAVAENPPAEARLPEESAAVQTRQPHHADLITDGRID